MNRQSSTRFPGRRGFAGSKLDGDQGPARALHLAVIFIAALLIPTTPVVSITAPDDPPIYSLVSAREVGHRRGGHMSCVWIGDAPFCPGPHAWHDEARSLAGPSVEPNLNVGTEFRNSAGWYRPVLLIILNLPEGKSRILAQVKADSSGWACIPGRLLGQLGWHPTGPDIVARDGGVCADLSRLAALPVPPVPVVTVLSEREFRRALRRQRKQRR